MFTSPSIAFASYVTTTIIVSFVIGYSCARRANADDRQKLTIAERQLVDLRDQLELRDLESAQQQRHYETRLISAQTAIKEYEEIFEDLEEARFPAHTAVVIPFKRKTLEQ